MFSAKMGGKGSKIGLDMPDCYRAGANKKVCSHEYGNPKCHNLVSSGKSVAIFRNLQVIIL
jgi:hypothetical protein